MFFFNYVKSRVKKVPVIRKIVATLHRKAGRPSRTNLDVLRRNAGAHNCAKVTVVIPVYNQVILLRRCAESLLTYTPADVELCFINDCSPEPEIGIFLNQLREKAPLRVTVLVNEKNLGFPATCNRGIKHAGKRDVILLNSDTIVSPRWLDELRMSAYGNEHIGTVSAVSNNSSFVSVPVPAEAGPLPQDSSTEKQIPKPEILAQVGRAYLHRAEAFIDAPTGHGFCIYIKREVLDEVGLLDEETFQRGYGEEVDFCMRAYRAGWMHRITSRVFVWHYNSASFGDSKRESIKRASEIIQARYPEFEFRKNLMKQAWAKKRTRFSNMKNLFKNRNQSMRPRLLFILGVKSGGTYWTNKDLMINIRDQYEPYLLVSNGRELELYSFVNPEEANGILIEKYTLNSEFSFPDLQSDEMDQLILNWVLRYGVEMIHIRHLTHFSTGFLAMVHRLNIPVILSFHDFFAISPTIHLIDSSNHFHPEGIQDGITPANNAVLSRRIQTPAPKIDNCLASRWKNLFARQVIPYCRYFVTTCTYARSRLMEHYPELQQKSADFIIIPHGRDIEPHRYCESSIDPAFPIKIFYLGACTILKGGEILKAMAEADSKRRLQIHLVGAIQPELQEDMNALRSAKRIVIHGSYSRGAETKIAKKRFRKIM